jgi:predicted  nucleic acid-binding Zn-ribbon protein
MSWWQYLGLSIALLVIAGTGLSVTRTIIRDRRRSDLDAALAVVRQIRDAAISGPPLTSSDLRPVFKLALRPLLDRVFRARTGYELLWDDNTELAQYELHSRLDGLERLLLASRRLLPERAAARLGWVNGALVEEAAPSVALPQKEAAFTPTESELLAGVTEKFYGSWAFRIMGMAIVAGALMAGAGTLYLAGQTVSLNDNLKNTAATATSDIRTLAKDTAEAIRDQNQSLTLATSQLQQNQQTLNAQFAAAQAEIGTRMNDFKVQTDSKINDFTGQADKLKDQAVAQIVTTIKKDLKEQESALQSAILQELIDIKNKDVANLKNTLTTLGTDVSGMETTSADISPKLDKLNELAQTTDALSRSIADLQTNVDTAHTAATGASADKETASRAALAAAAYRDAVSGKLQSTDTDLGTIQRQLGALQARLETAQTELGDLNTKLAEKKSAFEGLKNTLTTLGTDVSGMETTSADISPKLDKLNELAQKTDALSRSMADLQTNVDTAHTAAAGASADKETASRAALAAAASRDAVSGKLQSTDTDLGTMRRQLGALQARLETAQTQIHLMSRRLSETDRTISRVEASANEAALARPMAPSPAQAAPPASSAPPGEPQGTEANLSNADWRVIQQALKREGCDPGTIDGKPGRPGPPDSRSTQTRSAIGCFQKKVGPIMPDQSLTPDQIDRLLSGRPLNPAGGMPDMRLPRSS